MLYQHQCSVQNLKMTNHKAECDTYLCVVIHYLIDKIKSHLLKSHAIGEPNVFTMNFRSLFNTEPPKNC